MSRRKTAPKPVWRAAHHEDERDKSIEVIEPTAPTEFEVQATVWRGLCDMGINARGEVKSRFAGRAQVRFDVAVFERGALAGIVEIKKSEMSHATGWEDTRQGSRYMQFGVPVRVVYGMEHAQQLLRDAAEGRLWDV